MSAAQMYRDLLSKVDAKYSEIYARQGSRMQCRKGCHSCCQSDLSVFLIEKLAIKEYIESQPGLAQRLAELEASDPHSGQRCRLLSPDGRCEVYPVRPIICRSQGAPLYFRGPSDRWLADVCRLNFNEGRDLFGLKQENFINLELLDQILVSINHSVDPSGQRFKLELGAILS